MTTLTSKTKATILLENAFGFPIVRHVWLTSYEVEKKGFKTKLMARFTFKGKRKPTGYKYENAVICEGWQDFKGAFNTSENGDFLAFDYSKFEEIKKQAKNIIAST
jgi:hypothetical protein